MRKQWRCFHCDQVFTSVREAGHHFGAGAAATCACVLPHEQHLVEHIRDLQAQLDSFRDDRDLVMRSIMTLEGETAGKVRAAEEKGYARGVEDMKEQGFCVEPKAHLAFDEEHCPGHVASITDPKVCGRCGTHVDSLR